ncbi:MAG: transcriptional repressor [Rhodoluna sp.]|nr:transcriptional repressor [Rhodoluna sp.]
MKSTTSNMTITNPEPARRQTWQKDAVLHALGQAQGFVSAQQLHKQLTQHGSVIGLATVYRTLNSLVADGLADSLVNAGESLFRDCSKDHHHHLICNGCGIAVEIEAKQAETWATKVAKDHGFTQVTHTIDIFGMCKACSK